ncbi:MAG: Hpt domain-containing protein, partial [Lysobacter sp.]
PGLSESVLFAPDLDRPLPGNLPAPMSSSQPASRAAVAPQLAALRGALTNWPEDGAPADSAQLASAIDNLLADAGLEPLRRMLWVASSVAGALRDGALPPTKALRDAFAGVEREAREMLESDSQVAAPLEAATEPTRQLLYQVARSDGRHQALDDLRETFQLDAELPTESELAHARGSLSGRNRALLDTVSAAIKEDLMRVKDSLDLYLRTGQSDVAQLHPQVEALTRVSDTLGMMDLGVARGVVLQQRDSMQEIVGGRRPADESALLDIAGALLYVDASLDDQVARLGLPEGKAEDDMLASESRKVLDIVVREAIANFGDARQSFVAFVETSWDHAELAEVPRLLDEVAGALRILELPLPASYLLAVKRYAQVELIERGRVPNGQQLDTLADALASLEYYLEALRDQRPNREDILDIARQSLESLHYWPLPELRLAEVATKPAETPVEVTEPVELEIAETLAPVESVMAAPEPAVETVDVGADGFEHSNDIDDEIREVFLEELEEEIANLGELLPVWRQTPDDGERLRPIRRVFHTLKGSGRLVGAKTLGEYSWKIENMLNRVLDGTRPASPAVIALVAQVYETLPQLHAALKGSGRVTADLEGMQDIADRLAAGEEVLFVAATPRPIPAPLPEVVEPAVEAALEEVAAEPIESELEPAADADTLVEASAEIEEPTIPASIDPVLLEILSAEVNGHLATIEQWLIDAQSTPRPADDRMQRAIHTLNGAFAMTEVPVITDVTAPAELYVKRLLAAGVSPTNEGLAAMAAVAVAIRRTLATLESSRPRVPMFEGLAARMIALRDSLPAAGSMLSYEDMAEFAGEEGERLTAHDLGDYADLILQTP